MWQGTAVGWHYFGRKEPMPRRVSAVRGGLLRGMEVNSCRMHSRELLGGMGDCATQLVSCSREPDVKKMGLEPWQGMETP